MTRPTLASIMGTDFWKAKHNIAFAMYSPMPGKSIPSFLVLESSPSFNKIALVVFDKSLPSLVEA